MGTGDLERRERALAYFREAFRHQMKGEVDEAVELYRRSIETCPAAEAHTSLGRTYGFRGGYDAAIAECLRAIEIDPEFGNPYNDTGAYLIDKWRLEAPMAGEGRAATPLRDALLCALQARPRVGNEARLPARPAYEQALKRNPRYSLAMAAIQRLCAQLN